eukprot:UC1_evm2s1649
MAEHAADPTRPITELSNMLTSELDCASPLEMVRLLRQVDMQMFAGYAGYPGLCHDDTVSAILDLAVHLRPKPPPPSPSPSPVTMNETTAAADPSRCATSGRATSGNAASSANANANAAAAAAAVPVFTGSGTSGRMAFLLSRQHYASTGARYLCAGGDAALFMSREAPEDNWRAGAAGVKRVTTLLSTSMPSSLSIPPPPSSLSLPAASTTTTAAAAAAAAAAADNDAAPPVHVVGISCGLSAPYVAGQFAWIASSTEAPPGSSHSIVGFNPRRLARNVPIEGWDQTFASALGSPSAQVLPVVGPEALTGSTRMKGGSATKIVLEVAFEAAAAAAAALDHEKQASQHREEDGLLQRQQQRQIQQHHLLRAHTLSELEAYHDLVRRLYATCTEDMARLLSVGGEALLNGGHIYYLGVDTLGVLALVDASECPPTYNAAWDDVRAWICGGYATLANTEGDLSHLGQEYGLSWEDFARDTLPSVGPNDAVVAVVGRRDEDKKDGSKEDIGCGGYGDGDGDGEGSRLDMSRAADTGRLSELCAQAASQGAAVCLVNVGAPAGQMPPSPPPVHGWSAAVTFGVGRVGGEAADYGSNSSNSGSSSLSRTHTELATKLVLNALTTGAHVMRGRVMGNRMVDMQVSNNKLYYRGIDIVHQLSGVDSADAAKEALLRAIYCTDDTTVVRTKPISAHVYAATTAAHAKRRVIPLAIMAARKPEAKVAKLEAVLRQNPVVVEALAQI